VKKNMSGKQVKLEVLFTPLILIIPFIIGFLLIYDWYIRDFILNSLELKSELIIGVFIIFVKMVFDIQFIRSFRKK